MAMLITPEVEQITAVSAPSMIGMESLERAGEQVHHVERDRLPAVGPGEQRDDEQEQHRADDHPPRHPAEPEDAEHVEQPRRRQRQRDRAAEVAGGGGGQRQVRHRDLGELGA